MKKKIDKKNIIIITSTQQREVRIIKQLFYNVLIIKITLHYSDSIYFQSNTTLACIFKITQNNGKKKRDEEEE